MESYDAIVIGGGATGTGVLRDLAMRGIKALLLEQRDLAHGSSSRFHGLLHSGGRYAVKDPEAARECIAENAVLRRIAPYCLEAQEGMFVRAASDDAGYETRWLQACHESAIPVREISLAQAKLLEPSLDEGIEAAYIVPDGAIDGFRLVWQNAWSAEICGGTVRTYAEVTAVRHANGMVTGVTVRHTLSGEEAFIGCRAVINAAGSWVGQVAAMADLSVAVRPDRGALIAFNHRFVNRVINRLRPPGDADIVVPHGSIAILGTTSCPVDKPDDFTVTRDEVLQQLADARNLFPGLEDVRILRVFAGTRPIYSPNGAGRDATRNFTIIDHGRQDSLEGMFTIVGGKLTTYRLMAEKTVDQVCRYLGVSAECRTASEPLLPHLPAHQSEAARRRMPAFSAERAAARLGPKLDQVLRAIENDSAKGQLLCECEVVTVAEVEAVAMDATSFSLDDVRRKTRLGMGTCQGAFCGLRGAGVLAGQEFAQSRPARELLTEFLDARWDGVRPVLWGNQLREAELTRAIYGAALNVDGDEYETV